MPNCFRAQLNGAIITFAQLTLYPIAKSDSASGGGAWLTAALNRGGEAEGAGEKTNPRRLIAICKTMPMVMLVCHSEPVNAPRVRVSFTFVHKVSPLPSKPMRRHAECLVQCRSPSLAMLILISCRSANNAPRVHMRIYKKRYRTWYRYIYICICIYMYL